MAQGKEAGCSRLTKLLLLLEGGSCEDTRKAAAKQIVEITKTHPQQLPAVIHKVHACLYHKQWDTRIAAGDAFGLLADAFPQHTSSELMQAAGGAAAGAVDAQPSAALLNFNIRTLLEKGTALLASGGQEFELALEPGLTAKQRLEKQKEMLRKRIGLDSLPNGLMDTDELLNDEDVDVDGLLASPGSWPAGRSHSCGSTAPPAKQAAAELVAGMEGLSARERNRLKRKAKALNRVDSLRTNDSVRGGMGHNPALSRQASAAGPSSGGGAAASARTAASTGSDAGDAAMDAAATADEEWAGVCAGAWPLQWAADQMLVDVLDPCWEVRHGAAVGLRELLRSHAGAAGVQAPVADETSGWMMAGGTGKRRLQPVSREAAEAARAANRAWLEECVLMLLCVLALDHFADYGADMVTAPVRETAAQALACSVSPLSHSTILHIMGLLEQLQRQSEWAIRYGGYLGVKYLLAARLDLAHSLLPRQLPLLTQGLQDPDDDVCAASAAALIPLVPALETQAGPALDTITQLVWGRLEQLDALSPASASCMQLLSHLYSSETTCRISEHLGLLVPRLWPYLYHTLTTVRSSTAACLERLLTASKAQGAGQWVVACMAPLAHLVFVRVLVEADEKVQAAWLRVWNALIAVCPPDCLQPIMQGPLPTPHSYTSGGAMQQPPSPLSASQQDMPVSMLQALFRLASTPQGQRLPSELLPVVTQPAGAGTGTQPSATSFGGTAPAAATGAKRARRSRDPSPAVGPVAAAAGGGAVSRSAFSGSGPGCMQEQSLHQALHGFVVGGGEEGSAVRMHMMASQALASLLGQLAVQGAPSLGQQHVQLALCDPSAAARQLGATTLWYWSGSADPARPERTAACVAPVLLEALMRQLNAPNPCHPLLPESVEPYAEARQYYEPMRRELLALVTACLQAGWLLHPPVGVDVAQVSTEHVVAMLTQVPPSPPDSPVWPVQQRVSTLLASVKTLEHYLHMATLASFSAAIVRLGQLPARLNLLLQPLMAALRNEPNPLLQGLCAQAIAELLLLCTNRTPSPNDKLVRNLCSMAWSDASEVPSAAAAGPTSTGSIKDEAQQQQLVQSLARGSDGGAEAGAVAAAAAAAAADASAATSSPTTQAAQIARVGAEAALRAVCRVFQAGLWPQLPSLWQVITAPLALAEALAADAAAPVASLQSLINSLQILRVVGPHVSPSLVPSIESLLPPVCICAGSGNAALRAAAAKCLAALVHAWLEQLMPCLLRLLVPSLGDPSPNIRLGAVEVVGQLARAVGGKLAPYVVLLVVPLLRCMSDASAAVRASASSCFGALVALLPLAQGLPSPPGLDDVQLQTAQQDSTFLIQLLDNKRAEDFQLPVKPRVQLRPYQQEGINWLAFLRRFGLHGVLADDMGLGKTLQASCILAAALAEQAATATAAATTTHSTPKASALPGINSNDSPQPLACLIVCPSTLVQHWVHEMTRFMDESVLRPVAYAGSPAERASLQARLHKQWAAGAQQQQQQQAPNVVILSYEHLRADLDWVNSYRWLYCVLDEGHMIKNYKSKVAVACRAVGAQHRLILSGTPIQNSVLELWSLFEFLMPGFLGAEKEFNARYGKALKAAKYSKRGSREAEAGLLAVEALHKQVMPFVLRRTKAQVLSDLPPKIVQDIYCDMSPLQSALYEDFQASQASNDAASALKQAADSGSDGGGGTHVFQALHYMRRLCSHPAMVVDPSVPQHQQALHKVLNASECSSSAAVQAALRDIRHAPKLVALRELLVQCGVIGGGDDADVGSGAGEEEDEGGLGGAGHRLLVFAQAKAMLDLVERDVLVREGVSFLRLDGSIEASQRFGIVQRFNADPTIDVLLLTTSVGGLGLNLTSADTVVFLEHDWNPMKDLQAMDRAHRLGQTRTVNVYRLLMRGTLEEKVMGLQQFKLDVANAVVNQDNMSLKDMDTGQLLDLFGTSGTAGTSGAAVATAAAGGEEAGGKSKGLQAMLANMGELWDEKEYESQFNMQAFMQKLGSSQGVQQQAEDSNGMLE